MRTEEIEYVRRAAQGLYGDARLSIEDLAFIETACSQASQADSSTSHKYRDRKIKEATDRLRAGWWLP